MSDLAETPRLAITKEAELADGHGIRFEAGKGPRRVDGVLIRFEGKFYAYVNRCKHMPMPLDLVKNHFFTANKKSLRCQSHGAAYEPTTGKCFAGPCRGKGLDPLPISVEDGVVYFVGAGADKPETRNPKSETNSNDRNANDQNQPV